MRSTAAPHEEHLHPRMTPVRNRCTLDRGDSFKDYYSKRPGREKKLRCATNTPGKSRNVQYMHSENPENECLCKISSCRPNSHQKSDHVRGKVHILLVRYSSHKRDHMRANARDVSLNTRMYTVVAAASRMSSTDASLFGRGLWAIAFLRSLEIDSSLAKRIPEILLAFPPAR